MTSDSQEGSFPTPSSDMCNLGGIRSPSTWTVWQVEEETADGKAPSYRTSTSPGRVGYMAPVRTSGRLLPNEAHLAMGFDAFPPQMQLQDLEQQQEQE